MWAVGGRARGAVWVRRDVARDGGLPPICARGGQRCITRFRRPVGQLPAALEWATWTGMRPLLADADLGEVALPLLPRHQRRHRALVRLRDASAAVVLLALLSLGLVGGVVDEVVRVVGTGALAVHLLVGAVGWLTGVGVRVDTTGGWVRLSGVHADFAAAVEASGDRQPEDVRVADPALRPLGWPQPSWRRAPGAVGARHPNRMAATRQANTAATTPSPTTGS
jgi:hypothetical protein